MRGEEARFKNQEERGRKKAALDFFLNFASLRDLCASAVKSYRMKSERKPERVAKEREEDKELSERQTWLVGNTGFTHLALVG